MRARNRGLYYVSSCALSSRASSTAGKFHAGFAKSSAQVWVGSERVKLRMKALKSEQGFGCGRASFT